VSIFPSGEFRFRSWNIVYGSGELAASTAQHTHALLPPARSRSFIPCKGSVWHESQQPTLRSLKAPQVVILPSGSLG
jgi:hypothetical protein